MTYADLTSMDHLYESLDDPQQTARLDKLTPAGAELQEEWHDARTELKFCDVPWDTNYTNVVGWQSDEARDEYFEALEGDVVTLKTRWNYKSLEIFKPSLGKYIGEVRVPIPYETAMGYNYLYVRMYDQPVPQYGDYQRAHFYYHVTGIAKVSPSTTTLTLELDAWTEYMASATIHGVDLARGHYPMVAMSADQWLKNPLASPLRLDEPEPDLPDVRPMVASEHLYPLYDDQPLIIVGMLADLSQPQDWWGDGTAHSGSHWWNDDTPTGDSYQPRMTTQQQTFPPYPITTPITSVSPQDITPSSTLKHPSPVVPSSPSTPHGQTLTPIHYYAFTPDAWTSMQASITDKYPQLVYSIEVLFIIPSRYVRLGESKTFEGVSYRSVDSDGAWSSLGSYTVSTSAFGYDSTWAHQAKLYSGQFARIEVSDLQGNVASIRAEDIAGDLDMYARASTAWPFLRLQAFIDGIGGHGLKEYAVRPLQPGTVGIPQGAWEEYSYNYDVPTYALYADNNAKAAMQYASRSYRKQTAAKNYQRARAAADVSYANSINSVEATYRDALASTSATKTTATRSATTAYNNGIASADTAKNNAFEGAKTNKITANENATTARDNSKVAADLAQSNATDSAVTSYKDAMAAAATALQNTSAAAGTTKQNADTSAATSQADSTRSISATEENGKQNIDYTQQSTARGIDYDRAMKDIAQKYVQKEYGYQSRILNERNQSQHNYASAGIPLGSGFSMAEHQVRTFKASHAIDSDQGRVADPATGHVPKHAQLTMDSTGTLSAGDGFAVSGSTPGGDTLAFAAWAGQMAGQEALVNATISRDFDWAHQTIDFASSQAQGQFDETLSKTVDFNTLQNKLNHDNNTSVLTRQVGMQRANVAADYETALQNNLRTYNTAIANANRSNATSTGNAKRDLDTATGNADRSHTVALDIAQRTLVTANRNADRSYDITTGNASRSYTTDTDNIKRTNATDIANIATHADLSTSAAAKEYTVGKTNAKNSYDQAIYEAQQSYELAQGAIQADLTSLYAGKPQMVASPSGSGDIDQLSSRGLDVKIRRISKGAERQVAQAFARYGYRMPEGTWVDKPTLVLRSSYTYWQCRDVWLSSVRMSETARNFLRRILMEGTTIWTSADKILDTGLEY